ncbi:prepilin-type N-terminal cleavage/methylation domain-containing protein [Patescibacteria group bacterium]|nr:prepilin-type N-terminal cleavage/methylation domain-containing protein [Patescibacteria group bacterium]MBU1931717.1 prepilin-type N-terminal cleavage/methylation domain-containing protein [Patescibacteria group bacterium]
MLNNKQGQSLVEVLIGVVLLSVALLALTNAVVRALRAAAYARDKAEATKLATEANEWFRFQRDSLSWGDFERPAGDYCLNSLPGNWVEDVPAGDCGSNFDLKTKFQRQVYFDPDDDCEDGPLVEDAIKITINVAWENGNYDVELVTCLTKWQVITP